MKPLYEIRVHPKNGEGWMPSEYPYSVHTAKTVGACQGGASPFIATKEDALKTIGHFLKSWSGFDTINHRQYPLPDKTNTELVNEAPELIEDREIWAFLAKFKREAGGTPDITSFFSKEAPRIA